MAGRPAAGADALDFFEREEAVGRDALVADAELFLKALVDVIGAAQHATDVGADLHVVFAGRLEAQHGVVGGDVAHFEFRDADALGHFGDHRVGEIADLVLRVEQHGNQRRARTGYFCHQRVEASGQLRREKMVMVSLHSCISSRAQLRLPYPSLPRLRPSSRSRPASS